MLITLRYTIDTDGDQFDDQALSRIKETMAGVRDPAFWRRFSIAVHMDEEKGKIEPVLPNRLVKRIDTDNTTEADELRAIEKQQSEQM